MGTAGNRGGVVGVPPLRTRNGNGADTDRSNEAALEAFSVTDCTHVGVAPGFPDGVTVRDVAVRRPDRAVPPTQEAQ